MAILLSIILLESLEIGLRIKNKYFQKYNKILEENLFFPTFKSAEMQTRIMNSYEKSKYMYLPYLIWRHAPNQKTMIFSTNNNGYRGGNWEDKKGNTYRIILTGGSAAWGYGASSDTYTISGFLERKIEQQFLEKNIKRKVEVLNAAESGYSSTQEFISWKDFLPYKPDLVIHYNGYNDIILGIKEKQPHWSNLFIQGQILTQQKDVCFMKYINPISNLLENSSLYQSIKFHLGGDTSKNNIIFSKIEDIAKTYEQDVNLILDIGEKEKIPVIIILQPSLFVESKQLSREEKIILQKFERDNPGGTEYIRRGYNLISNALLNLNSGHQFIYIDGTTFFSKIKENIYFDPSHYSDEGNNIIAEEINSVLFSPSYNYLIKLY